MRVAFADAGAPVDVAALVQQMDNTVAQLWEAWNQIDDKFVIMLTQGQAAAAQARIDSLAALIRDLDVGGVARQHVFFPLAGQTQGEAWLTWVDTANYVRGGLQQVGRFISKWSLSSVLPRIAEDIGDTASSTGQLLMWAVGGVLAIQLLSMFQPRR